MQAIRTPKLGFMPELVTGHFDILFADHFGRRLGVPTLRTLHIFDGHSPVGALIATTGISTKTVLCLAIS